MELLLYNGKIHTMDKKQPQVSAVYIKDGVITATGSDDDVLNLQSTATAKVVNLEGRCAVPGFNDSHMHLLAYARDLSFVDLRKVTSIAALKRCIRDYIDSNKVTPGHWVIGAGWNQDYFEEKRFPDKQDLDQISMQHPIIINRACRHMLVANTPALRLAGVAQGTHLSYGLEIGRDGNGAPTGAITETAMKLFEMAYLDCSVDKLKSWIKTAAEKMNAQGLTSVQSDDFSFDYNSVISAYTELAREDALNIRVNQQCRFSAYSRLDEILSIEAPCLAIAPRYRLGPVKLLADGSLGARTALMRQDYMDKPGERGIAIYEADTLDEIIRKIHLAGRQAAVHAIGDRAVEMVLDSVEKAVKSGGRKDVRHCMIHCQITDKGLLGRIRDLQVNVMAQPIFLHYDMHIVESRVGKEMAATSYNFKTLHDMGVHVAFGTDCPIEPFNPLYNIYCAVNRKDLKGYPPGGFYPEERMTVSEAVSCYTTASAYVSGEEQQKGSITVGKYGDIAILSEDIFSILPEALKEVSVEMTVCQGKIVHERV